MHNIPVLTNGQVSPLLLPELSRIGPAGALSEQQQDAMETTLISEFSASKTCPPGTFQRVSAVGWGGVGSGSWAQGVEAPV